MLIGDVFYFDAAGTRLQSFDRDVTAEYAERASRSSPNDTVEWCCTNGDRRDVRRFRAGRRVS